MNLSPSQGGGGSIVAQIKFIVTESMLPSRIVNAHIGKGVYQWKTKPAQTILIYVKLVGVNLAQSSKLCLKVHKIENFFDSDFGICVISLLVMSVSPRADLEIINS